MPGFMSIYTCFNNLQVFLCFTVNNRQFHRYGTAADAVVDTSQQ